METPRKFITAQLSIRKPGSSSVLIIYVTCSNPFPNRVNCKQKTNGLKIFRLSYRNNGNGVYKISVGNNKFINVYCQMTSISGCKGGGWTMVMKIKGSSVSLRADVMTVVKL